MHPFGNGRHAFPEATEAVETEAVETVEVVRGANETDLNSEVCVA